MRRRALSLAVLLAPPLLLAACATASGAGPREAARPDGEGPAWSEWSREAFARARAEGKPILLSVQAGWCHWCHVMNDVTYRDPAVRDALEGFVLIRADGDARPDLADRYRRYAWPATVFLSPDGAQILALRGYRPPSRFAEILGEVRAAHREGRVLEEAAGAGEAPAEDLSTLREALVAQLDGMYDEDDAGWGRRQRYPFAAPVEHAFLRAAARGEARWRARALDSLARYAELIDPVWGGMYQYSERGVWDRPHFEKIVPVQAGAIAAFAEAYRVSGEARWLAHAESIHRYLREHLRARDGAFYASQDADLGGHGRPGPHVPGPEYYALDDAGRRALGEPRVDTHVYASTNGMLIEALAELHVASGRVGPLRDAVRAARRILETHRRDDGLLAHADDDDDPRRYLQDQAHVLAGLLALHQATGEARWLDEARRLADALEALRLEGGGFAAHTEDPEAAGFFEARRVPILENGVAARALLTLARLTDEPRYREWALDALRAAGRPGELRRLGRMVGEYLLALEALEAKHVVIRVVGRDDAATRALADAARAHYDPRALVAVERPGDSRYPYPGQPAAYLCSGEACSMPVTDPAALSAAARAFLLR